MKLKNKIVALFLTVACAFGLAVANGATKVEAAETYTHTFAKTDNITENGDYTLSGLKWNVNSSSTYFGWDNNGKGVQLGSSGNPAKTLSITSESLAQVSSITINTSGASSVSATLKIYVGSTEVKSYTMTSSATNVTAPVDLLTGPVKFEYSNSSKKALYVKSISITYDPNVEVPVEEKIGAEETMVQLGLHYNEKQSIEEVNAVINSKSDTTASQYNSKNIPDDTNFALDYFDGSLASSLSIVAKKNNGTNSPYLVGGEFRLYWDSSAATNGTGVVLSSDANITNITFTAKGHNGNAIASFNDEEITISSTAYTEYSIDFEDTNTVEIKNVTTANYQVRISSMSVTISGETYVTSYENFNNAKLRFVGVIPSELADSVDLSAGAGVVLTLADERTQTVEVDEQSIVVEADGSLRFAVVLNVPAEQYDTVVTGQAFVYLHDATEATYLAEKSFSVNSIVDYYLSNSSTLGLDAASINALSAFRNA